MVVRCRISNGGMWRRGNGYSQETEVSLESGRDSQTPREMAGQLSAFRGALTVVTATRG